MFRSPRLPVCFTIVFTAALPALAQTSPPAAQVDKIFAGWTRDTPGCVVGVGAKGKPVLTRAYGMADLEHGVRNSADTIFEAGSVSKQFTAAAVALLARDGKLSLDDPVRKYIPELPDYGTPITIRHMLQHTSGLRDWGSVAEIGGWPRTTRVYTPAHVLDIVARQGALNFTPGTRWSYSNTGYNLAAIIVERVSGMTFGEFSRQRIFAPLGMDHTSWRDDYTRILKNRAIAYEKREDGFHSLMPFENAVGNGGLLTTVGDLLKWNENFVNPVVGDARLVAEAQQPGKFADGRPHNYGLGLFIGSYKGVPMVSHGGATAGYRSALNRYPAQHVSVALLCNAANANAGKDADAVAELFLDKSLVPPAAPKARHALGEADLAAMEGLYRETATGLPLSLVRDNGALRTGNGRVLHATGARRLESGGGVMTFEGGGVLRTTDPLGTERIYQREPAAAPAEAQLRELAGSYASADAETSVTVALEAGALVIRQRPDTVLKLEPVYRDAFRQEGGLVIFRRDAHGKVTGLSMVQDRVWDMRFERRM
ncbi:MAG: serine hydrolase domain-containing protein [Massilia sp.]